MRIGLYSTDGSSHQPVSHATFPDEAAFSRRTFREGFPMIAS